MLQNDLEKMFLNLLLRSLSIFHCEKLYQKKKQMKDDIEASYYIVKQKKNKLLEVSVHLGVENEQFNVVSDKKVRTNSSNFQVISLATMQTVFKQTLKRKTFKQTRWKNWLNNIPRSRVEYKTFNSIQTQE